MTNEKKAPKASEDPGEFVGVRKRSEYKLYLDEKSGLQ